jgi:hypothetical protein
VNSRTCDPKLARKPPNLAHIDMIGGTGGGKSTAMRHLAWQHMEGETALNRALIVIDPHGLHPDSLFRTTLRRIVETELCKIKKVSIIDANSEFCTGLKLLQSEAEPSVMGDHMIEAFERMQGDETLLEKPTLRRALHGLLAVLSQLGWSLAEADLLLDSTDSHGVREWAMQQITDRYARKALQRLQYLAADPRLRKEFEVETIGTENRLAPLLSSRAMRAIVGHEMLDMRDVLDQGGVLLVNTAGHNAAYETAGDLLGKLVMRAILFAAKRRRTNSLVLVFADECARFVSQDWERALAELRKYRVGIVSAHQTFAMLGEPGDPVREAIEKIPATKMAFRLNSMQEAALLAPDLVRLNLEMPVSILNKETVVGYEVRRMRNSSVGDNATETDSFAKTATFGEGVTHTRGQTAGESEAHTRSTQTSRSKTQGWSHGVAEGETYGSSTAHSHVENDTTSETDGTTTSRGSSSTRGGGRNDQTGTSSNQNFSQTFSDVPMDRWRSGEEQYRRAARNQIDATRGVSAGYADGENHASGSLSSWADGENESSARSTQHSRSKGVADGTTHLENYGTSSVETDTESESTTEGVTDGVAFTKGTNRSHSASTAYARQASSAATAGKSRARGRTSANGWSESLVPILKLRPSAIHSLQNVTHMAAEMLCSLPTGVAVVRTIKDGRIEGAIVRVPFRDCPPVSDEQYVADLRVLMPHSIGKPMGQAIRQIEERENKIIATASSLKVVEEPRRFRVPIGKARKRSDEKK